MSIRYWETGRKSSVTRVITAVPSRDPLIEPRPPNTTTAVSSVDLSMSNITG